MAKEAHALLDIALDHLSLGRAYLRRAQCENIDDLTQASGMLNRAVDELRKTGVNEFLAYGLLARAELYRVINDFVQARYDLDEAFELASGCNMRLRKADCYIGYVHLYLALSDIEKARENFLKAKELVSEIGYHRRNKELRDLERKLT